MDADLKAGYEAGEPCPHCGTLLGYDYGTWVDDSTGETIECEFVRCSHCYWVSSPLADEDSR